jgi:hypothetical protein
MDPALKEYLDSMRADAAALQSSIDAVHAKQDDMSHQIEYQSTHLLDLCGWKPEIEARFAQLEATVANLQRTLPASAAAATDIHQAQAASAAAASGSGAPHFIANPLFDGRSAGQVATARKSYPGVTRR